MDINNLSISFYYVNEKLPENGEYVLIHLLKNNWGSKEGLYGKRYWKVAQFIKGISKEERNKMEKGELPNPVEIGYTCPTPPGIWRGHGIKRSSVYTAADEDDNNKVPYCWEEFGTAKYFGQEVDIWGRLPIIEGK